MITWLASFLYWHLEGAAFARANRVAVPATVARNAFDLTCLNSAPLSIIKPTQSTLVTTAITSVVSTSRPRHPGFTSGVHDYA